MKFSLEQKALVLAVGSSLAALAVAFGGSRFFRPVEATSLAANRPMAIPREGTAARHGYTLFMLNCAHCHGADAHGDEGPDLHGVRKSDERIVTIIQNGIKGEMPKFSSKLSDEDTRALVAVIRTL